MADIVYFDDDYVASGYTVYTAFGTASEGADPSGSNVSATTSLSASAQILSASDLAGYVHPDYFDAGYVSQNVYASAALSASTSTSATATLEIYATATADGFTSQYVGADRTRQDSSSITLQSSLSASADVLFYASATVDTTVEHSTTPERQRRAGAQNLTVAFGVGADADVERNATATLNNAITPLISATYQVGLLSNESTWDEVGVQWQTYPGSVWGANTFILQALSGMSASASAQPGLAPEEFEVASALDVTQTFVGQTKTASASLSVDTSVSTVYTRVKSSGLSATVDTTSSQSAVYTAGPTVDLPISTSISTNAIFRIIGSATLASEFIIDIVVSADAFLFPTATLQASASRTRSSPSELAAQVTTQFTGIVGHTEFADAALESIADILAVAAARRNASGTFQGVNSTIAYGRILGFDPVRNYDVDSETRYSRVLEESTEFVVGKQQPIYKVTQESGGLLVPQETRNLRTSKTTYQQRRQLA